MSDIKARLTGGDPEGERLGVVLEDGDIYPLGIPHGGELPTEIDGRKVSTAYRDGLLAQEDKWTRVRRESKTDTKKASTEKDGDK